jgi:Bifunctional DNA primase/polymerase, N-terminal
MLPDTEERRPQHKGGAHEMTQTPDLKSESSLAFAALDYARRGWPVFPCRPRTKEPATTRGFLDATVDLDQITKWWWYNPGANIGIATGAPGPDVFDVDVKPEGTGWPAFDTLRRSGRLAGALMLVSTRNGGAHVYFTGTDQRCSYIRKLFVDFKAAGGYVLAPPSTVDADDWAPQGTGRYHLVWSRGTNTSLDWASCRTLLTPPVPRPRPTGRAPRGHSLDGALRWLAAQPADDNTGRHLKVKWAAEVGAAYGADESFYDELRAIAARLGLSGARIRYNIEQGRQRVGGAA